MLLQRRQVLTALFSLPLLASPAYAKITEVRIGFQTAGDILKDRGILEKRLAPLGVSVKWFQFSSGPPLVEALNAGAIDLGPVGESPPIFAQAAGGNLVYLLNAQLGNGEYLAIVVPKDSAIRTISDLKGKKIALVQASAGQYFLVKLLEKAGLKYQDVRPVNLPLSDARSALLRKDVDAWVAWDPYLLMAAQAGEARVLHNARDIPTPGVFYLATRAFATANPEILKIILTETKQVADWTNTHTKEAAQLYAAQSKLSVDLQEALLKRRHVSLRKIDNQVLTNQQQVADLYYKLGLLPKQINVREATLTKDLYAKLLPPSLK
jgi:sulfonate transport system substrate-binding protein